MMSKLLFPAVALAALFAVSASTVQAGPFEKAGLTVDAGRKLSEQEADTVRGGFRGGDPAAFLAALGIDSSLSREQVFAQLKALGRDEISSRLKAAGIDLPTMGAGRPPAGSAPPEGFKPPAGFSPPPGFDASKVGQRAGFRARSLGAARR
jgi:hypothetical protein